ncbi:MAG: trigger factor [Pseudomonadales bacterium]|nr:trigger factor [Pseudomonadales bacterium]
MQVSVEITSGLGRRLTIGVPATRIDSEVAARLEKAARSVRLKGFRQGKVPMKVVRQRFGAGVRQEVLGEVMSQSFFEAVRQEDLKPAGQPVIEPRAFGSGRDLEFTATFEVYPEIELIDFGKLSVERPIAEVTDADIDHMIDVLRNQQATWIAVERAARDGDRVNIDFTGRRDGEEFDGGSAKGSDLHLGTGRMIPGFESGLEGMSSGETRTLDLSFPDDYHAENLRGAQVQFEVRLNAVSGKQLPELDDEFFVRYGVAQGGLDAFRVEVRSNMERELKQALRNKVKGRVMNALHERSDLEVPQALVKQEIVALRKQTLRQFGGDAARFDESMLPDEMFRAQAERRVAMGLLLGEVIRKEAMKADPERVRTVIEEMASTYEEPEEVISWYYGNREQLASVEAVVLEDQVIDLILERAAVAEVRCNYEEALRADAPRREQP